MEAGVGEALADAAHVAVHAEDLLDHHEAARGVSEPRLVGAEAVAVARLEFDHPSHLALPGWVWHHPRMAEIVNLRRARKARARVEAAETATAERARHGRTRAEKVRDSVDRAQRDRLLDGVRRTDPPSQ